MKTEKIKTKVELFICNYQRENNEECCFNRGAKELTDELKKWSKENYPQDIKVIRSGCLSKCSEGIVMVCYPGKEMKLSVEKSDVNEIKKGLIEAL